MKENQTMAIIRPLRNHTPRIGEDCFLAETATLIGDVEMGDQCSIWYNAVLRGDVNSIRLGNKVNIQDNVMIHCTFEKTKALLGNEVSVGHNAIIHGCTIEDLVLIGMGAIVMDNAYVETGSLVAAGAVVTEGTHIRKGELWAGIPAKKIKNVSPELMQNEIERIAQNYIKYSDWYKSQ